MTTIIEPTADVREAAARRAEAYERGEADGAGLASRAPMGLLHREVSVEWMRRAATVAGREPLPIKPLRAKEIERDGKTFHVLDGYYTVYERGYEMWDWYGPYTEIVTAGAGDKTTAASPDVIYLENHRGLAMARTINDTLRLWSDEVGGRNEVWLNSTRDDVRRLVSAINDGIVTEQSFGFMITKGQWSPDYMEYRINEYDLDRGDNSAVNYGANPYTSVVARARDILDALDHLPPMAARAAIARLQQRIAVPAQMTRTAEDRPQAQMTPETAATLDRTTSDTPLSTRTVSSIEALLAARDIGE